MTDPDPLADLAASPTYAAARRKLAVLHQGQGGDLLTHEEGEAVERVQQLTGSPDPDNWPDPVGP